MLGTSIPTRPCRARVLVHVGRGSLDNQHGRLGITVPTGDPFVVVNFIHWWSDQSPGRIVGSTDLFYDSKVINNKLLKV